MSLASRVFGDGAIMVPSESASSATPATPSALARLESVGVTRTVRTLGGGVLGGYLWKDHRVLGFLGGATVAECLPSLLDETTRKQAVSSLAIQGVAIGGSLAWKGHPILGYVAGMLVGGAIVYGGDTFKAYQDWSWK